MSLTKFNFGMPGSLVFEVGAAKKLAMKVKELGGGKVFISTDKGVVGANLLNPATGSLEEAGIDYVVFDEVEPNPSYQTVEKGFEIYKSEGCDCLVGIGGGSPIDTAKAIGVLANNPSETSNQFAGKPIPNPIPPLVAIPTTAGTGSEVTQFSVVTDTVRKFKDAFFSPLLIPKVALLDPNMLLTLPPKIVASTGMDALTHAIEAYISLRANPVTDALALEAIKMVSDNLRAQVANPGNINVAGKMLIASTLAGVAFNDALTGIVHAMAHPLSAIYGIPHGAANAVLLPHCMEFCRIAKPEKYLRIAQAMGESTEGFNLHEGARLAVGAVIELSDDVGIPDLNFLGAKEEDIDQMTEDALNGGHYFTPRKCDTESVKALYQEAFEVDKDIYL